MEKQPLGILPEIIWAEKRIAEIISAFSDGLSYYFSTHRYDYMILWADELKRRLTDLKELNENNPRT